MEVKANNQAPQDPVEAVHETVSQPKSPFWKSKLFLLVIVFILIVSIPLIILNLIKLEKPQKINSIDNSKLSSEEPLEEGTKFFLFSIPKPLASISIHQLPNTIVSSQTIKIDDSLWFTAGGTIVEYNAKNGQIISYSDLSKANCDSDIVLMNKLIYVACRTDNIDDAFETTREIDSEIFMGHYSIFKIDPSTHEILYVYNDKDGLRNRYNYDLYPDGDYLWVGTFQGVARINTKTNKVDFYEDELANTGTSRGVDRILVDESFIWAAVGSNAYTKGGLAKFNKTTNSWEDFNPTELKDYETAYFDLEFIKTIPGGIQVAFRDGNINDYNRLVQKTYIYKTGLWTKINEQPYTGEYHETAIDNLKTIYPQEHEYKLIDKSDLTQIRMPNGITYKINGRNNLLLSDLVNNKRYVLTNASVDVIEENYPFTKLHIKLGEELPDAFVGSSSYITDIINFLVDNKGEYSIITDNGCGGIGCGTSQEAKIWLLNLKEARILRLYSTSADNIPPADQLHNLRLITDSEYLTINDKNGKSLFRISKNNHTLTNFVERGKIEFNGEGY